MKIQVVGMPSEAVHNFASAQDMIDAAPSLGWTFTNHEDQPHLAKHLISLPKFKELYGPMDGGDGMVRYETWPAQELYSS